MEISINQTDSKHSRTLKNAAFQIWELIDFGRNLLRPTLLGEAIAIIFGLIFLLDTEFDWGWIDFSGSANSLLSPFYFSFVTFTTVGTETYCQSIGLESS